MWWSIEIPRQVATWFLLGITHVFFLVHFDLFPTGAKKCYQNHIIFEEREDSEEARVAASVCMKKLLALTDVSATFERWQF